MIHCYIKAFGENLIFNLVKVFWGKIIDRIIID